MPEEAWFYVRPNCCEAVQDPENLSVYLREVSGYLCDCSEEREPPKFRWVIGSKRRRHDTWLSHIVEIQHCPFCGQKLPELRIVDAPGPVMTVTDGGYYCATCHERLNECECYPPEACWAPWGGEAHPPRLKFIAVEHEAIVFRVCFREREAFVPDKMREQAEKMAAENGRKIVSVRSDELRTRFVLDKPFSDEKADSVSEYWWGWEEAL
jgi:hypothetical protein